MGYFQSKNSGSRQSLQVIFGRLKAVHNDSHAAYSRKERRDGFSKSLSDIESQNPELATLNKYRHTAYMVMIANIVAAYVIDCVLFGAAIDYFARMSFEESPKMLFVLRFVVPLAVICIETNVAYHFAANREEVAEFGNTSAQYWFWLGAGLILSIAMPAFGLGTHIIKNAENDLGWGLDVLTVGLAFLAFCTHAGILFGGAQAHEAKAFVIFKINCRRLRGEIERQGRAYNRECRAARVAFTDYMRRLQNHNVMFPSNLIDPGPFDVIARIIINEIFGYEIIQPPAAPGRADTLTGNNGNGSQTPPASPASPTPETAAQNDNEGSADGENEYLRTILNRKMRDDDSEVRP